MEFHQCFPEFDVNSLSKFSPRDSKESFKFTKFDERLWWKLTIRRLHKTTIHTFDFPINSDKARPDLDRPPLSSRAYRDDDPREWPLSDLEAPYVHRQTEMSVAICHLIFSQPAYSYGTYGPVIDDFSPKNDRCPVRKLLVDQRLHNTRKRRRLPRFNDCNLAMFVLGQFSTKLRGYLNGPSHHASLPCTAWNPMASWMVDFWASNDLTKIKVIVGSCWIIMDHWS